MRTNIVFAIAALVALTLTPSVTGAQDDLLRMSERPGQFFLDGPMRKMVAHMKSAKHFRLCLAKGQPNVPIIVEYDENENKVQPGDCFDFEASKVWVKQAKPLSSEAIAEGYIITGSLHKVK
jgi:hypothetical protein